MSIYNTLTRKKEEFKSIIEGKVGIYLCGPTVYDSAHLGHGRSAVAFDVIRRYFLYKNFDVNFVSNYTDIDDKMINRAKEKNISVKELSEMIIPLYERDYGRLNVMPATTHPRATNYVDQIIALIKILEEKGATYELEDGIYFNISVFPDYGKLSKQNMEDLQMGSRVQVNENKKNPQDFALWKKEKPGEPSWNSPWGKGRPGWHIECSAMSMDLLGETFDVHAGGADLVFPHHECEVAQSECATSKQFANYWMHNGFININKEKMSKSLGNFITLENLLDKYPGNVIRFLYLQTHYRSPINFSEDLITQSINTLERINDFIRKIEQIDTEGDETKELVEAMEKLRVKFEKSMDDDFETPEALAAIFEFIKEVNKLQERVQLTINDRNKVLGFMKKVDNVFAIIFTEKEENLSGEILDLIKEREEARTKKDWGKSDELRDKLKEKGILVEDTPKGTIWKKAG
ncbi:cysteine--tRNA ligase [bacterium]|nr:cysteine--tRNA ligase [bacterium]